MFGRVTVEIDNPRKPFAMDANNTYEFNHYKMMQHHYMTLHDITSEHYMMSLYNIIQSLYMAFHNEYLYMTLHVTTYVHVHVIT